MTVKRKIRPEPAAGRPIFDGLRHPGAARNRRQARGGIWPSLQARESPSFGFSPGPARPTMIWFRRQEKARLGRASRRNAISSDDGPSRSICPAAGRDKRIAASPENGGTAINVNSAAPHSRANQLPRPLTAASLSTWRCRQEARKPKSGA